MNTEQFLEAILPAGDHFFAVQISEGRVQQTCLSSPAALTRAVTRMDTKDPGNVYFALASYKQKSYKDAAGKRKQRTQENVDKLKCFWVDLDCKGKGTDYADQREAILDIKRLCNYTGLPLPTIVNSGYGIHAYWVLTTSIDVMEWQATANRFRTTLDAHGVKHDSSCTTDSARILRPVGAYNKKAGAEPREVKLIGPIRDVISLKTFSEALSAELTPSFSPIIISEADLSLNEVAEAAVEYRPSSIKEIVQECGLLKAVAQCGGNVSEPLWHKTIGVVKHTIEGAMAIHLFSKGHPNYSAAETDAKAAAWTAGPSTCEVLRRESSLEMPEHCKNCKHAGTITSPIQLGYPKILMVETMRTIVADKLVETIVEVPALPPSMTHTFEWRDEKLWKSVLDKEATKVEGKPIYGQEAFCEFLFYPFSYYDDENEKHRVVWRLREREGVFREFDLSGGAMGAGGQALFKELGDQSVAAMPGGKNHMEAYITNFVTDVKKKAASTTTYTHFGWNGENFLLGEMLIMLGGEHKKARLGGGAAALSKHFVPKGSTERWKELINKAYGYAGQEQYQFIIGTGFGAPLIHLMGQQGGVVVSAISYESGQGKSTAGQLAMGIYGSGRSGHLSLTKQQVTDKAIFGMAGVLHSLPISIDEMTNIDPLSASNIIYTYSQGSGRITLNQAGGLNLGRHDWSGIMNTSANNPLSSIILGAKPSADAELARLIEVQFENVSRMTKEEADPIFEELYACYGYPGIEYMTWVQSNLEEVKKLLRSVQGILDSRIKFDRRDRFWSYGLTATVVGLMIAKRIGLISFDVKKVIDWIATKVGEMRNENVSIAATPEECFSRMLTDLSPGIIVTDIEGDKRGKVATVATIIREPRAPYTGRSVVTEGRAYLIQPMVHRWCTENQVGMKTMMAAVAAKGWLIRPDSILKFPAKGTNISMGQFKCFILNLEALEQSAEAQPNFMNVVSLIGKKREG